MNNYIIAFKVYRKNDDVIVLLLPHKNEHKKYTYINLTKGHICPCVFNSVESAINDMKEKMKTGEIVSFKKIMFNYGG